MDSKLYYFWLPIETGSVSRKARRRIFFFKERIMSTMGLFPSDFHDPKVLEQLRIVFKGAMHNPKIPWNYCELLDDQKLRELVQFMQEDICPIFLTEEQYQFHPESKWEFYGATVHELPEGLTKDEFVAQCRQNAFVNFLDTYPHEIPEDIRALDPRKVNGDKDSTYTNTEATTHDRNSNSHRTHL